MNPRIIHSLKKSMRVFSFLLLIFISAVNGLSQSTSEPAERLWQECVKTAVHWKNHLPAHTDIVLEFLSPEGALQEKYGLAATIGLDEDGKVTQEITGLEKLPGPLQQGRNKNTGGALGSEARRKYNPFIEEVQPDLKIIAVGREENIDGMRCAVYNLKWRNPDGERVNGTVWLGKENGVPYRLIVEPVDLPAGVIELTIDTHFKGDGKSEWYPYKRVIDQTVVRLLVVKQRLRNTMWFRDYMEISERMLP